MFLIINPKQKKIIIWSLAILLVVGSSGFATYAIIKYQRNKAETEARNNQNQIPVTSENDSLVANKLDGTQSDRELAQRNPLAVVIDNSVGARPQAGLSSASIVYEALAEGGVTRLLAIFGPKDVDNIGPVRSARTYFVEWAEETRAYLVHAGGSQNALTKIVEDQVPNLNDNSSYFSRQITSGRAYEHTLFTNTTNLYQYAKVKGYENRINTLESWLFKDDLELNSRPTSQTDISINFGDPAYAVKWEYNPNSNDYTRYIANQPHTDSNNSSNIVAKNIILIEATRTAVTSAGKQVYNMTLTGSGDARIIRDGKVMDATWKRSTALNRTHFYDKQGTEIELNRGQIWIEIINPDIVSVSY